MVDNKKRKKKGGCTNNGRPPCGEDCPKNKCDGNCNKKLGHVEKHKCDSCGHKW